MAPRRATLSYSLIGAFALSAPALAADPTPAPAVAAVPPSTGGAGPVVRLDTGTGASGGPDGQDMTLPDVSVIGQRLDQARSAILPSLGATTYDFNRSAIATLPQGDNAPLNQTLLQAPGVAQDSFGQIHVRGDHNEVQYRLDGVQLPEGLSVFGQALENRFAHSLSLLTGALPAQYGFLTAGVVDITTKTGRTDPGGEVSIYGGARDYFQPSFQYGGQAGSVDYFVTGDLLHDRVGIENPDPTFNPVHDLSNQYHGLVHLSDVIDANTRVSLIAGVSNADFQIPNNPNQSPSLGLSVNGTSDFTSANLAEHQREITDFAIVQLQKQIGAVDVQSSVFTRYSSLYYTPDPVGDLLFTGVAQTAARSVTSTGEQTDASWKVAANHTLRAGFQVQVERGISSTDSSVLPTDDSGAPLSDQPFNIHDGSGKTGALYGLYLQDEWRILPNVTINYGARFDGVSEYDTETQLSPRVNVVWKPTDTTTLHAGYSRYFTPPPFELVSGSSVSLFNNTSAAAAVTQDSVVKAERDDYYDVGIDQVLLPGLRVGVDGYYKQAHNLIDEGQFGSPIILSAFNYAQGQVNGVEFSSSYDRGPWSLYGNVATSRAIGKDIDSAQFNFTADELATISQHWIHLDHDQRWTGSGGVAYTALAQTTSPARLSADLLVGSGLRADYSSALGDVPNGRALPGYYTINLAAVQTLNVGTLHGTQLRLDVLNLLDRKYAIRDGTGVGVGAPQYGLRRTILAGLAQRF